jgi:hypothetical protein
MPLADRLRPILREPVPYGRFRYSILTERGTLPEMVRADLAMGICLSVGDRDQRRGVERRRET